MTSFRGAWFTKDDVLNDLAQVNGRLLDFDDIFIVKGERPPPPPTFNEEIDEELKLRFGSETNNVQKSTFIGPDLQGITRLLREIDSQDGDDSDGESISPEGNIKQPKDEVSIITISKLNPDVEEFVPKPVQCSSGSNDGSNSSKCGNNKNSVTKEKPDVDEIKETVAELKNKINATSKKNCMKSKKEKNVAIAALMKLSSSSPRSMSPIKLCTPQYFEETKASDSIKGNKKSEIKIPEKVAPHVIPDSVETSNTLDQTSIIPDATTVQTSIDKVESWLQKPECIKPKQPVMVLSAVTFKKKEVRNNSPSSDVSESKTLKHKDNFGKYVPSSYVEDLYKKFDKQKKEKAESLDWATKLEKDLKERDQKILKERKQKLQNEKESTSTKSDEVDVSKDDSS